MTTDATQELSQEQVWNEVLAEREGTTGQQPAAPTAGEAPNLDDATNANDGAVTDDNQKQIATGAAADDTSASTPTGQEPKNEPTQLDQIMEQIQKLTEGHRHLAGHIGGLKSSQLELTAAMEAARKQTTTEGVTVAPTKGQVAEAAKNPEEWESLKKDFPEWADATEKLLGARLQNLQAPQGPDPAELDKLVNDRVNQLIGPLRESLVDSHLDDIFSKRERNGKPIGWKEEVRTDDFGKWLNGQPEEIKALAKSPEMRDAARMLRLYESSFATPASAPDLQIQQSRQNKLANASTLPKVGSTPAAKTVDQMTDQEVWDMEAKRREKRRETRGY